MQRVSLKTDARNARSRAAIERLGAQFDGVLRRFSPAADAGLRDAAFFSILDSEWPEVKSRLESRLESALPPPLSLVIMQTGPIETGPIIKPVRSCNRASPAAAGDRRRKAQSPTARSNASEGPNTSPWPTAKSRQP